VGLITKNADAARTMLRMEGPFLGAILLDAARNCHDLSLRACVEFASAKR
jgi:hypothetical protein